MTADVHHLAAGLRGDLLICPDGRPCATCQVAESCAPGVVRHRWAVLRREQVLRSRGPGTVETPWDPWEVDG